MGLDARIRYTKMVIKDTFIALLKEKPVNKVTVKEICDLAEINRATFYKYYSDPFDLLDKIELEMLSQLQSNLKTSPRGFREIFIFIMGNIRADGERYRTLVSENGDSKFPGRIVSVCYEHITDDLRRQFPGLSPAQREWLYSFSAQGCCGILERWISGGMREDVEEVSDFAQKLMEATTKAMGYAGPDHAHSDAAGAAGCPGVP